MKKKILLLCVCILLLVCIFVRNMKQGGTGTQAVSADQRITTQEEDGTHGIPRAEAFRLISYLYDTDEDRANQEETVVFQDVDTEAWYYEYIVSIYLAGFTNQADLVDEKCYMRPTEELSTHEGDLMVQKLSESFDLDPTNVYQIANVTPFSERENEKVTRTQFLSIYEAVLGCLNETDTKTHAEDLYILAVNPDGKIMTQNGEYYGAELFYLMDGTTSEENASELSMKQVISKDIMEYIDERLEVVVNGNRILYVRNVSKEPTTFQNVYLIHGEEDRIQAYVEGYTKTFQLQAKLNQPIDGMVGNLTCQEGQVTGVSVKPDLVTDKVLLANKDYIELANYGKVEFDDQFHIYKIYDDIEMEETNAILVGYSNTKFVLTDNKISAALITEPITATNIRVMIKTNQYKSLFHSSVTVTCKKPFVITYGEKEKHYSANKEVTLTLDSKLLANGRCIARAEDGETSMILSSIKRAQGKPSYRGSLEFMAQKEGICIINELPMEEYLYAVLPSEMPASYGKEALKTQAVCARSYAYNQLLGNAYREYGAHIDDSSDYQVYNNYKETKQTIEAVKETYGQVIKYDNKVITAYYFSTSCGTTSSMNDVWPGATQGEYLVGSYQSEAVAKKVKKQGEDAVEVMGTGGKDFSKEEEFRKFLLQSTDNMLESKFAWYRWDTKLTYEELSAHIENVLKTRYEANPALILTEKTVDGYTTYESKPIRKIGKVKGVEVKERKPSGIVTEVLIQGSKANILVKTEYNIRKLLAPESLKIVRKDDSVVTELTLLPSAFFVCDQTKDGIELHGGGYGHGVGMSQNGVKALVDLGYQYEEIIPYYYRGTKIDQIYE